VHNKIFVFASRATPEIHATLLILDLNCRQVRIINITCNIIPGINNYGQNGDGRTVVNGNPAKTSFYRPITSWFSSYPIAMVSAGVGYSLALTTSGTSFIQFF
jgi:hypothetical protein